MTTTYGTTPAGFVRKPLAEILASIEAKAQEAFEAVTPGVKVVQTPQSPLGQLNGMMASLITSVWEMGEGVYQSYDPDQAEGARLDQLGRIRLLNRVTDEIDVDFRQAITNAGRARIDIADIERAVKDVPGVTWARVFVNDTSSVDPVHCVDPHTVSVAVIGGDDAAVAAAIREYVVPGVETFGNTLASAVVEGICRPIMFVRPVMVPIRLRIKLSETADRQGCPPPSFGALRQSIADQLSGPMKLANGDDLTMHVLRLAASCKFPHVEIVSATAFIPPNSTTPQALPIDVDFFHMLTVAAENIEIAP